MPLNHTNTPADNVEKLEREALQQDFANYAYAVSHDLQAPLRQIREFFRVFVEEMDPSQKLTQDQEQALKFINNNVGKAEEMLNALLKFSRLNTLAGQHLKCSLKPAYEKAIATLSEKIELTGATINPPEQWPAIFGDPAQLEKLFFYLLDNALKFQPEGQAPIVNITVESEEMNWWIHVTDNGIGVAPEHDKAVFDIFRQLHAPGVYPGIGSGLALAKKIVQAHEGIIFIRHPEAGGTQFVFTVPNIG